MTITQLTKYQSNRYWQNRAKKIEKYRDELEKVAAREMERVYKDLANLTETTLRATFDEIAVAINNQTLLVSDLYRYQNQYKLFDYLKQKCAESSKVVNEIIEKRLVDLYVWTSAFLEETLQIPRKAYEKVAERLVKEVWCSDGKNFSTRLWQHTGQLEVALERGLTDLIISGRTTQAFTDYLRKSFGVIVSQAQRIIRTEMTHVQNSAATDRYADAGIIYVQFLTAPPADGRICEECKALNNKIFPVSQAPTAIHPNCRCTLVPVFTNNLINSQEMNEK